MSDYPTEGELEKIETWQVDNLKAYHELMDFINSIWWSPDFGWRRFENTYTLATGGWSGNEDIIGALRHNQIFWMMYWKSSERGGKYVFKPIRDELYGKDC